MKLRLTMITGVSMMLILTGLYVAITGHDGPAGKQFFFTMTGILGWWCGNKLIELEERLDQLENSQIQSRPTTAQSASMQ